jgi:hypothetical protein
MESRRTKPAATITTTAAAAAAAAADTGTASDTTPAVTDNTTADASAVPAEQQQQQQQQQQPRSKGYGIVRFTTIEGAQASHLSLIYSKELILECCFCCVCRRCVVCSESSDMCVHWCTFLRCTITAQLLLRACTVRMHIVLTTASMLLLASNSVDVMLGLALAIIMY